VGSAVLKRLERAVKHSPSSVGEVKNEGVGISSSLKCLLGLEWENLSLPVPAVLLESSSSTHIMSNYDVISEKLILKVVE
jgi:hypothetical protein